MILLHSSCSTPTEITGGETGGVTETIGIVVSSEGVPLEGVHIKFIPTDYIPQQKSGQFLSCTSNESGEYSFIGIPDGAYNLMYDKDGEFAFRESLSVTSGALESTIIDTLLPFGSFSGVVQLHENHNSGNVFIILRGTNRFCTPLDSTGRFNVDSLAEGEYRITFIADYDYYSQYDTTVTVTSALLDTLKDTITLEYLGIETPNISSIDYDTSLLYTTLRWNAAQSENVSGYQVFRKTDHLDSTPISIAYLVQDTFFVDSCNNSSVLEGKKYLYQVSCINHEQMSGKLSNVASIVYSSLFSKIDSLQIEQTEGAEYVSMVSTDLAKLYLVTSNESMLHKIDLNNMTQLASYPLPDSAIPTSISLIEDNTLLIATNKGVYNVDTTGIRLWRYSAFHTKNESGTSGQYTRNISSFNQQYFYHTSSMKNSNNANIVQRFNCYTGESDTLGILKEGEITSLNIGPTSDKIYLAIKYHNSTSLESTPLNQFSLSTIYNSKNSSNGQFCFNKDSSFSYLNNKVLLTIEQTEFSIENKKFLENSYQAVSSISTGDRILFCRDGKIITIRKNQ